MPGFPGAVVAATGASGLPLGEGDGEGAVAGPPPPLPTTIVPFMPIDTCTLQKYGKVPALGNLTVQLAPFAVIWAMPQSGALNLPSPAGLVPSPDTTGCGPPATTRKVTASPGWMRSSAGSHLSAAVPWTSFFACAAAGAAAGSARRPAASSTAPSAASVAAPARAGAPASLAKRRRAVIAGALLSVGDPVRSAGRSGWGIVADGTRPSPRAFALLSVALERGSA